MNEIIEVNIISLVTANKTIEVTTMVKIVIFVQVSSKHCKSEVTFF